MNIESFPLDFERDYPIAQEWANNWWKDSDGDSENYLKKDILPTDGAITYIDNTPAVVSFQYFPYNSKVCFMAFLISNPSIRDKSMSAAIDSNLEKSRELFKEKGFLIQTVITHNKAIEKHLTKNGYHDGGNTELLYLQHNSNDQLLAFHTDER